MNPLLPHSTPLPLLLDNSICIDMNLKLYECQLILLTTKLYFIIKKFKSYAMHDIQNIYIILS